MLTESNIKELNENGFTIVKNVLNTEEIDYAKTSFYNWQKSLPNIEKFHRTCNPHGIFKFHEAGHADHSWFIRTRPQIIQIFKKLWQTDDLVVSFDGCCHIPKDFSKKDDIWTHTDQAPNSPDLECFQSFVSLTNNSERTIILYKKTHKLHQKYFEERNIKNSKNWQLIDHDYLASIEKDKCILNVEEGDMVIWDSRTFHQNRYGKSGSEERIVQYICFMPKNNKKNTKAMVKKRLKYFEERRTTSHWAYPIKVNSLQPQTYGDNTRLIDYNLLIRSDLSKYLDIIKTII
jgi:ectoine hydroxylase-related dioxygenase (phytanoyl-CoA dioxygenase family)